MDTLKRLAKEQPFGPNGRVKLGFAMDTMFVQPKVLRDAFKKARDHGVHLITSHVTRVSMMDSEYILFKLSATALLLLCRDLYCITNRRSI
jgi:hypothetical protein